MKIELGTVQFGIPYGIANSKGQVEQAEVKSILDYAKSSGISSIDTAISYGTSEKCLGEIGLEGFQVITKLPEIPENCGNLKSWVLKHIQNSLTTLSVDSLSGLLLHRPLQLLDSDKRELWPILLQLKTDGYVKKVGFSIYTPDELDNLWDLYKPDLIQAPYSIFDRRLDTSGWLDRLFNENVEVHIRSIFLQGLLLMNKNTRPTKFNKWFKLWRKWDDWLVENNVSPLQAAVSFSMSDNRITKVTVGVDSLDQLKEIICASNNNINKFPRDFNVKDSKLLNPSEWSLL